jgi:hypothetical protein
VLTSTDALRNPISVEKLQGPIVMITAGIPPRFVGAHAFQGATTSTSEIERSINEKTSQDYVVVALRRHFSSLQ